MEEGDFLFDLNRVRIDEMKTFETFNQSLNL